MATSHAGYKFSGKTAGRSYSMLANSLKHYKTLVLLGPFHHYGAGQMDAEVSSFDFLETPLGNPLIVAREILDLLVLKNADIISKASPSADIEEHSLELQFPFLAYLQKQEPNFGFNVAPIYVRNPSEKLADALLPLFKRPDIAFIVSSDFCHWGRRFRYTFVPEQPDMMLPIWERIKRLDFQGIHCLQGDHQLETFQKYLQQTGNTICGKNPILLILSLLEKFKSLDSLSTFEFTLLQYSQSSQVKTMEESSVSYVAAAFMCRY